MWLAILLWVNNNLTARNSTRLLLGAAKSTTPVRRSTRLRCLRLLVLASSIIHATIGSARVNLPSVSRTTWASTAPTLWPAKRPLRSEPVGRGRWPHGDGGQYLPSPYAATPFPLGLLSGDLDFGIFQFLPVFSGGGTLTLTTPQALEYLQSFSSFEYHQNLSLLEHHRTLTFCGRGPTVVPTPPGGAPPSLWKPSSSPPPLLWITPPSPPFLAVLGLGMSLRGWRHAGFLSFLFGVTPASGSPVTDTRGTLDEYSR